jgi:hypothetical protein
MDVFYEARTGGMTMENRKKLAIATICRAYLNIHGFITPAENRGGINDALV